jgi:hypothetical protein
VLGCMIESWVWWMGPLCGGDGPAGVLSSIVLRRQMRGRLTGIVGRHGSSLPVDAGGVGIRYVASGAVLAVLLLLMMWRDPPRFSTRPPRSLASAAVERHHCGHLGRGRVRLKAGGRPSLGPSSPPARVPLSPARAPTSAALLAPAVARGTSRGGPPRRRTGSRRGARGLGVAPLGFALALELPLGGRQQGRQSHRRCGSSWGGGGQHIYTAGQEK